MLPMVRQFEFTRFALPLPDQLFTNWKYIMCSNATRGGPSHRSAIHKTHKPKATCTEKLVVWSGHLVFEICSWTHIQRHTDTHIYCNTLHACYEQSNITRCAFCHALFTINLNKMMMMMCTQWHRTAIFNSQICQTHNFTDKTTAC